MTVQRFVVPGSRRSRTRALALAVLAGIAAPASGGVFRGDDPITRDRDDLPGPVPFAVRVVESHDVVTSSVLDRPDVEPVRALDINTLGEVPDSSWFTNRIGIRTMSVDELVRGCGESGPPAPGTWTVYAAKTEGHRLGFRIRDPRGVEYLLKFEAPDHPEAPSAAEVISSRILHAAGYNVPENHVTRVARADLAIAPGTRVEAGRARLLDLTPRRLDGMLKEVARETDGRFRVTASALLPGTPIGPFRMRDTRGDDLNDLYAHQHRRALRGLYVISSWLDHTDSGAINTLDTFHGDPDRGHVRHYLVDFDSTLGSSGDEPKAGWEGFENDIAPGRVLRALLTAGLAPYPGGGARVPRLPGIGRNFEVEVFSPGKWRPRYPNPAFANLDTEDAFWATRILLHFSDDDLRAIVRTGGLSDPQSEDYLAGTLIARRDAIARHWLARASALDGFRIESGALVFQDLSTAFRLASASMPALPSPPSPPVAAWSRFDNFSGARTAMTVTTTASSGALDLPAEVTGAAAGDHFVVRLTTGAHWVDVFLRRGASGLAVVGIERDRRPAFAD